MIAMNLKHLRQSPSAPHVKIRRWPNWRITLPSPAKPKCRKTSTAASKKHWKTPPGVSFDGSGRYGLSDITIRGVSGNRVKVLVDGQEINSQFSFGPFQNAGRQYMDLNNVKQLEVIKGPVSSLHGSDAIGGVVSLVSKTPDDYLQDGQRIGGTAFSQYSGKNHGITAGGAIAVAPSEQWDGLISYTYNHEHETQNHGGRAIAGAARTTPDPQRDHSHSVEGKLRYKPNADHTITFAASAYQEHRDTNVLSSLGNSMNLYRYDDYQGKDKHQRTAASLRHDFTLNQPVADSGYWRLYWQKQNSSQKKPDGRPDAARRRNRNAALPQIRLPNARPGW